MSDPLLITALRGKRGKRVPFWYMRQAGRYLPEYRELRARCKGFLHLCYTPELAAEVTLQPLKRFDMDAAILFSDILVIAQALGAELAFLEGEGPKLSTVRRREDMARLSLSRVEAHIRPVLETVRRVRAALPEDKALIGFAGGPWTVACYMVEGGGSREFENVRRFALSDPQGFSQLMALIEEATLIYVKAQIEAGAQVIQWFDSWAGILPPPAFARWVSGPTARLTAALRESYPQVPVIGFPRLAGMKIIDYAAQTKVNAVGVDHTSDMKQVKDALTQAGCHAVPQGNLDPMLLACNVQEALDQTRALLDTFARTPFVFNLGHGMLPDTPVEHVQKLSELVKRHGG